jgi:hypothetical protein
MTDTQTLLADIEKFLVKTGMRPSALGHKTVNDGKLVQRLRDGGTVTIETAAVINRFIAETEAEMERAKLRCKVA